MAKRVRCRCPLCGMLVTQKQLDGEYDFEFVIQETGSRGRGRIYNVYRKPDKVEGKALAFFKVALAQKVYALAERLLEAVTGEAKEKGKEELVAVTVHETDEYDEVMPSAQMSSVTDYDESVIVDLEAESTLGGEEEWQDEEEISAKAVLETTSDSVLELSSKTVLE